MNDNITHLIKNTRWKTVEIFGSYGLYLIHKYLLFTATDSHFFGKIGTIYGLMFFLASALRLGFEAAAAPHFALWSRSQEQFYSFIKREVVPTLTITFGILACCLLFIPSFLQWHEYLIILTIIFFEVTRKIVKTFLNLLLDNQRTAWIELIHMAGFMTMVWISWIIETQWSLSLILTPHLIMSIITVTCYLYMLFMWYQHLPQANNGSYHQDTLRNRFFVWISQLMHQCCSSNLFIPLIASQIGFAVAGECYLLSSVLYTIMSIVDRIYGSIFLAQYSRNIESRDITKQHPIYHMLLLGCITLLCLLVVASHQTATVGLLAGTVILIGIEYGITAIEKKLIVHNQSSMLLVNAVAMIIIFISLSLLHTTLLILFSVLTGTRLALLLALAYVQKYVPSYSSNHHRTVELPPLKSRLPV